MQLGRLLGTLPKRNVLVLAADLNCPVRSQDGLVGLGVLKAEHQQTDVDEWMGAVTQHDLCVLNTWGSARRVDSATCEMNDVYTQIDLIIDCA